METGYKYKSELLPVDWPVELPSKFHMGNSKKKKEKRKKSKFVIKLFIFQQIFRMDLKNYFSLPKLLLGIIKNHFHKDLQS